MKNLLLLVALTLASFHTAAQNKSSGPPGPDTVQINADVLEVARKMMANGGEYEADINGTFAQMLRKQLQDDKLRVTMKGKVLEKLPDGCVWAEFTARTPDKSFTSYIKNRYLVKGPLELKLNGRYCDSPELYNPQNN